MALLTGARRYMHRLGDANPLPCGNAGSRHVIPAMKVFKRNAEAVCDLHQRVAAMRFISLGMGYRRSNRSHRHHQRIDIAERVAGVQLIDRRQLLDGDAIAARYAGQRVVRSNPVIAPLCPLFLWNFVDALQIERRRSRRQMEIERTGKDAGRRRGSFSATFG